MGNISSSSPSSSSAVATTKEFSIANKKLHLGSVEDVAEYVKTINNARGLEIISLSGNTLGVEACKALAAALSAHDTIKEVNLSDCFTGRLKEEIPLALEAFGRVLSNLPSLIKLDISDNALGPAGARAISELLARTYRLQELYLNNNGLGVEGGCIVAEALQRCQQANDVAGRPPTLRRISIGRNRLENGSAETLSKAIEVYAGSLEEIRLYQNGIRPEGIVILSRATSKCSKLLALDFQDNTFTETGAKAFSTAIPNWPKLEKLNIGDCLIGDVGCMQILTALTEGNPPASNSLTTFNFQYNELNEQGAMFIAKALDTSFSALQQLMLNGNSFDPEGVAALAIQKTLKDQSKENIIDVWDDMEYFDDNEDNEEDLESEEETEEEREEEEEEEEEEKMSAKSSVVAAEKEKEAAEIEEAAAKEKEPIEGVRKETVKEDKEIEPTMATVDDSVEKELADKLAEMKVTH